VRAAYRALAKKYHPDVAGKFQISDLAFRAIAEAYAVLSDVEKRRIYDASLDKLGANTARTFTDEPANTGTRSSRSLADKLRYGAAALLVFGLGAVVCAAAPDADGRPIFLGPLIGRSWLLAARR
jgi:curved DNA-binding protein CbpA